MSTHEQDKIDNEFIHKVGKKICCRDCHWWDWEEAWLVNIVEAKWKAQCDDLDIEVYEDFFCQSFSRR